MSAEPQRATPGDAAWHVACLHTRRDCDLVWSCIFHNARLRLSQRKPPSRQAVASAGKVDSPGKVDTRHVRAHRGEVGTANVCVCVARGVWRCVSQRLRPETSCLSMRCVVVHACNRLHLIPSELF